jgi:DNA-directed RNA polymerase specialized sigma24 family protein
MADNSHPGRPERALWQRVLNGDRDAFEEMISPHRDALLRAARTSVESARANGDLREDSLTPEELAGETLLRAFDGRERYPSDRMSLRAWLLGLQLRALRRISSEEDSYHERKAISLDEEVPVNERYDHVEEAFYEFGDPFDVTTYDELIPSQTPDDVEVDMRRPLTEEELTYLENADLHPQQRMLVELHDEFELSIQEVAQILEQSLQDTAEAINTARVHIRHWIGTSDENDFADREIDSYTGEPIDSNPTIGNDRGPTADEPTEDRYARAARDASTEPPSTND